MLGYEAATHGDQLQDQLASLASLYVCTRLHMCQCACFPAHVHVYVCSLALIFGILLGDDGRRTHGPLLGKKRAQVVDGAREVETGGGRVQGSV